MSADPTVPATPPEVWRDTLRTLIDRLHSALLQGSPSRAELAADLAACERAAGAVGGQAGHYRQLYHITADATDLAQRLIGCEPYPTFADWARTGSKGKPHDRLGLMREANELVARVRHRAIDQELNLAVPAQRVNDQPHWDGRTLTARGKAKTYSRQPAPKQRMILDAFQKANWTTPIQNPFETNPPTRELERIVSYDQLRKRIGNLNTTLKSLPIRFSTDALGRICWEWKIAVRTNTAKLRQS